MLQNIAAAILAGGEARRLNGLAKGNILLAPNITVIGRLLDELNQVGLQDVVIAGENPAYRRYQLPMITDKRQHVGPLAGIEAVLEHYQNRFAATLFLPCDLPKIMAREIKQLINQYDNGIVFATTNETHWHPLCAVVQNSLLADIQSSIDNGMRSIKEVWHACGAKSVFFSNKAAFANLNNWQDFA
jgi:molybdopterin-guanine dinucleotide biosynthesis protein A